MNLWFYGCELLSEFCEAWLAYLFIGVFLPDRSRGKGGFLLLSFLLVVTSKAAEYYQVPAFLITLWFVFYICMTTVLAFQVDVFYAVSLVSFYILCVYIIDFFCLSVMGVLGQNQGFSQMVLSSLSLWRCVYLLVDKCILILCYGLMRFAFRRELRCSSRMLFTVSLLGLTGVGFLAWMTIQETTMYTLFSWGLFLVLLFLFYFLLLFYSNYRKAKEEQAVIQMRDEMISQEYELYCSHQKEREELSHDLKSHLTMLSSMLAQKRYQEAEAYVERISEPLIRFAPMVWTGNQTLDVLLNYAKRRAESRKLRYVIRADAIPVIGIEDNDICCLFANLLDNAYEAAVKGKPGEGFNHVTIRKVNEMLFICISNSMEAEVSEIDKRLMSTKTEGGIHGLGLGSARKAAEKYGGELEYEYGNGVFTVRVTFLGNIDQDSIRGGSGCGRKFSKMTVS